MNEVKLAGTFIYIEDTPLAKITSFSRSLDTAEEDITGAENSVAGTDRLNQIFSAIAVGETLSLEGIAFADSEGAPDQGQSQLKAKAEAAATVELKHLPIIGVPKSFRGFFTGYEESGPVSGAYRFSGSFRVSSKQSFHLYHFISPGMIMALGTV